MKRIFIVFAAFVAFANVVQAQTAWTLDRCIEYAEANNLDILHRKYEYNLQQENLKEAKQSVIPTINLGAQENFHHGSTLKEYGVKGSGSVFITMFGAELQMPLFTGLSLTNNRKSQQYRLLAAEQNIKAEQLNLKINIVAEFLQILYSQSQENIAREHVELSRILLNRSQQLVSEGKRPESEIAHAQADLSHSEYLLVNAHSNVVMAKVALANRLNVSSTESFEIVASDIDSTITAQRHPSKEEFIGVSDAFPTIASAKYAVQGALFDFKAIRGTFFPQLGLFATYSTYFYAPLGNFMLEGIPISSPGMPSGAQIVDNMKDNGWGVIGLRLTVPILNARDYRKVSKAKLAYRDANTTLNEMRLELTKQLRRAYYSAESSWQKYLSAVESERASKIAFDYNKELYEIGRTTLYDLNQSRIKWLSAQEDLLTSRYEYITKCKILDFYTEYTK